MRRDTCLRCTPLHKTRARREVITASDVHNPAKQLAKLVLPSGPNPGSLKAFKNCIKTQLELQTLIAAFLYTCSSAKPPTSQCAPKFCVSKEFYRVLTCLGESRFRGHKATCELLLSACCSVSGRGNTRLQQRRQLNYLVWHQGEKLSSIFKLDSGNQLGTSDCHFLKCKERSVTSFSIVTKISGLESDTPPALKDRRQSDRQVIT